MEASEVSHKADGNGRQQEHHSSNGGEDRVRHGHTEHPQSGITRRDVGGAVTAVAERLAIGKEENKESQVEAEQQNGSEQSRQHRSKEPSAGYMKYISYNA